MLVAFIVLTLCSSRYAMDGSSAAAKAVIGMIFIYYFFYNLTWLGLLIGYTAEILPYKIRAKDLTVMFLYVDLALFFNQYINPIALDALGWKYYIFYCWWLGVELATVYFFYIETHDTPLEGIVKHFDSKQAVPGGGAATEKGLHFASEAGFDDTVRMTTEKQAAVEVECVQHVNTGGSFKP